VQIVKTVLGDVFPDIKDGFKYADKIKDWVEYVNNVYQDPLGTLGQQAVDYGTEKTREAIKERIKNNLERCCSELPENIRNQIVEGVTNRTIKTIQQALTPDKPGGKNPAAKPGITATVKASDTPLLKPISPTATATSTPTATPTSTPTETPTTTPTLTSTPDTSWIDGYVDTIGNQLVNQGQSPIGTAIVIDDLRNCLINSVRGGLSRSDAISRCSQVIKNLPTVTPTLAATPTQQAIPPSLPQRPPGSGGNEPPSGGSKPPGG
jgi:hypothetical protein